MDHETPPGFFGGENSKKNIYWKFHHLPGDSKWPFYPLFGGHLTFEGVT